MNPTSAELAARLSELLRTNRHKEPTNFPYFESMDASSDALFLFHAEKTRCPDVFEFWVRCCAKSMQEELEYALEDFVQQVEAALWQPIKQEEWERFVLWSSEARWVHRPLWFDPKQPIRGGWLQSDEWNYQPILVEYEETFVGWHWSTSA